MKSLHYTYLIILALVCTAQCSGMQRITKWPPLLWCVHETPLAFVQNLHRHDISVVNYLKSQVDNAQNTALDAIQQDWQLPEKDIKRTQDITALVRAYGKRSYENSLPKKIPYAEKYFEPIHNMAENIMSWGKVENPIEVVITPKAKYDTFILHNLDTMIHEHNGQLTLSQPLSCHLPQPTLAIGSILFALTPSQQFGILTHTIVGHIKHEHKVLETLIKRIITQKGIMPSKKTSSYESLLTANVLAADILPTTINPKVADEILDWLLVAKAMGLKHHQHLDERIKNMTAIENLFSAERRLLPPRD